MSDAPDRPHGFSRQPQPHGHGSAARGQDIVQGRLALPGTVIEGDFFAADLPSPLASAALHGFAWLDDLATAGSPAARSIAQTQVLGWAAGHQRVPPSPPQGKPGPVWAPDVTGRRLLRWVLHSGMVLPGLDRAGSQPYFDSLHAQMAYLARHAGRATPGLPRTEALAGLVVATLALRGAEDLRDEAVGALAHEAGTTFAEGALKSRNPEELLDCHALLALATDEIARAGRPVPRPLAAAVAEILPVLRTLRHADGSLPRFHGGGRGVPGRLDHALRGDHGAAMMTSGLAMGYARLARGRATVILDAAPPPAGIAAASAHASTLGFELTAERHPIVVNCGSGRGLDPAWSRACRATPCHSTLCLSGVSSARLLPVDETGVERLTRIPSHVLAGDPDSDGNPRPFAVDPAHAARPAHIMATHDGWMASHGLTHLRELWLSPAGDMLKGEDTLAALDQAAQDRLAALDDHDGVEFDIRFHLHPDVSAAPEGDHVRLILPGADPWVFRHDAVAELRLEPSVWLEPGQGAPVPSQQIVLSATLGGPAMQIGWTFARALAR